MLYDRCMHRIPRPVVAAVAAGLVVVVGAVAALVMLPGQHPTPTSTPSLSQSPSPTPSPSPTESPSPTPSPVALCPVTGLPLATELAAERVGLVVQIDNDPHSRPQTGLSAADLIVEATVQGNVTRFGALFYCNDPGAAVGPIRSARYYNRDLWQQMGSLTVGFGGAPYTIQYFVDGGMPYLNGSSGWGYFRRSSARVAPYNVYAGLSTIRNDLAAGRLDQFKVGIDKFRPPFAVDPKATISGGRVVSKVNVATTSFWRYSFTYNPNEGRYVRADGSKTMIDASTNKPVTMRTVVVQRVTEQVVYGVDFGAGGNPILHHLTGVGTGTVYVDGVAIDVRWSRPDAGSMTSWTYSDSGKPLVLPPGPIWWEILPTSATITEG